MIVKSSEADRLAKNPPRGLVAALVYGPDSGLVRERSVTLLKTVVDALHLRLRQAVAVLTDHLCSSSVAQACGI